MLATRVRNRGVF